MTFICVYSPEILCMNSTLDVFDSVWVIVLDLARVCFYEFFKNRLFKAKNG